MGWTSFNANGRTASEILTAEFTQTANRADGSIQTEWTVIDQSTRGREWYAIIQTKNGGDGFTRYFCAVVLWSTKNGQFFYKSMGEDDMPYYFNAPRRILDKLDQLAPNPEPRAAEWREKCREKSRQKTAEKNRIKPCAGMHISYGAIIYELLKPAGPRRGWIVKHGSGQTYRLPARAMAYAVPV